MKQALCLFILLQLSLLAHATNVDYHQVLGVNKNASADEIKFAWRQKAQKFHPDRNPGHEDEFKCAKEAYEVLSGKINRPEFESSSCAENSKSTTPKHDDYSSLSTSEVIFVDLQQHLGESPEQLTLSAYRILESHLDRLLKHEFGNTIQIQRVGLVIMEIISKTGLLARFNLGRLELYEAASKGSIMYLKKIRSINEYAFIDFYKKVQNYFNGQIAYMQATGLRDARTLELRATYQRIAQFSMLYRRGCDSMLVD